MGPMAPVRLSRVGVCNRVVPGNRWIVPSQSLGIHNPWRLAGRAARLEEEGKSKWRSRETRG